MIDAALSLALDRREPLRVPPEVVTACAGVLQHIDRRLPAALSIGVTSALPAEGRSTVAAGLAIASALTNGVRTVLLDACPVDGIHESAALAVGAQVQSPGGTNPSQLEVAIDWVLPELGVLSLSRLLPPGQARNRSVVEQVLKSIRDLDALVVADLPALPPYGAADRFARVFDAVVLVARAGATPLETVTAAVRTLPEPAYVVLNGVSPAGPRFLRRRVGR